MNPRVFRFDPEEAERAAIARLEAAAARRGPVRTFADIDRDREAEGLAVTSSWDIDTPFAPGAGAPPSDYQMRPLSGTVQPPPPPPPPPLQAGSPGSRGVPGASGAPSFAAPHLVQSNMVLHMQHMQMQPVALGSVELGQQMQHMQMSHVAPHVAPHMQHMQMQHMQMPMQHHMQMPLADAEHFHANDWPPSAAPFGGEGFGGGFGSEGFGGEGFGSGGFGGEGFGSEGFSGQGFGGEGFGRGDGGGGGGFGSESFGGSSFAAAPADPFAAPAMGGASMGGGAAHDPFGRFGAASEPGYRAGLELPAPPPRRPVTLMDPSGAVVELPTDPAAAAAALSSSSSAAAAIATAAATAQSQLPQLSALGGGSNQRPVAVTLTDPSGAPILLEDAAASPSSPSPLKPSGASLMLSDPPSPSRPVTLTDASGAPIVVAPPRPSSDSPLSSAPAPQSPRTPGAVTLTDASGAPILPRDGADPVATPRSSSPPPPPPPLANPLPASSRYKLEVYSLGHEREVSVSGAEVKPR